MGRDIKKCHPRLQEAYGNLVEKCRQRGIEIGLGECFRTVEEQDDLYAQGRTKPGNIVTNARGSSYSSQHQWGIAFDFYLKMDIDGDGAVSDDAYNDSTKMFKKVSDIAKTVGLSWGGDWKSIIDKPHLYLPDWGSGTGILKQQYGTFDRFKKTWENTIKIEALIPVSSSKKGLTITASSLVVRETPGGKDTGKRYKYGEIISVTEKCFLNGAPWMRTKDGWISGNYVDGWIFQDGRWWYCDPGYKFPANSCRIIDGSLYAFDPSGWMLESKNFNPDGSIY